MPAAPPALRDLIARAEALGLPVRSLGQDGGIVSLKEVWGALAEASEMERQIPILDLIQTFSGADTGSLPAGSAALVTLSSDRQEALLTLLPPPPGQPPAGAADIRGELTRGGVLHGVDAARVEACAAALRSGKGWILSVPVAAGTAPTAPEPPRSEVSVATFSLERMRRGEPWTGTDLLGLRPVAAGTPLGLLHPGAPGVPGRDVTGRTVPAPRAGAPVSERIAVDASGRMSAGAEGVLLRLAAGWDLLPLFLVHGDYRPESGPIRFPGIVAVEGSCRGTEVEAEELLVGGDLAGGRVVVRGDVHVAGTLSGGAAASLSADGMVTARAIASARVDALGDVLARRAIANAEVTSLGRVTVLENGGELSGGSIAALRGVEAPTLGSDFGVPTAIAAGRDFLTPRRLEAIEERIALHQENLRKIAELKHRLAVAGVDVRHLPPEKQDVFLGVLKKETGSRQELAALERQRERFRRACADLLEATVRAREALHPPVEVRIAGTLARIQERLRAVVLAREGDAIRIEEVSA